MADNSKSNNTDVAKTDESNDVDISFVVALFDDVSSAKAAYKIIKELRREGFFNIHAAAYMEKTDRSKIKVHEYKDWSGKKGVLAGGAAGTVLGIIGGAVLLPLSIGALVGGIFAKVHDTGFSDKNLRSLADSLPPGTSALIAITEDTYVEQVEEELKKTSSKSIQSGEIPKSTYAPLAEASDA